MDVFEQYFGKQLDYSYYKYETQEWYDKGIDSLVLNKDTMPYYICEIIDDEEADFFYIPVFDKEGNRHRFLDSEADYAFYFKKQGTKLFSFEPSVIRAKAKALWQDEAAKYKNLPLAELVNGVQALPLPISEFEEDINTHKLEPSVIHLLKNYYTILDSKSDVS